MARLVRGAKLDSRESRLRRLDSSKDHGDVFWLVLEQGVALGYYKPEQGRPGTWWVRRRIKGKYRKARLGLADDYDDADGIKVLSFAQAQRAALDQERAAAAEGAPHTYTVGDALSAWWDDYESRTRSEVALREQRHKTRAVRNALGSLKVGELTVERVKAWLAGIVRKGRAVRAKAGARNELAAPAALDAREVKRRRQSTANRQLATLKAALNQAWRAGKVRGEPVWQRVAPFKGADQARARYLSHAEATRLLNASPAEFRPLVHAAMLTGCRWGELREMRCAQYDAASSTVHVLHTKAGRDRRVPLTAEGAKFFEKVTTGRAADALMFPRREGTPWGDQDQKRPMAIACAAAKITPAVGFHTLRHTYGSLLAQEGVPLKVIAAAMGHADTRMTERHYAHLSHDYVAETVRANLPTFEQIEAGNVIPLDPSPRGGKQAETRGTKRRPTRATVRR